MKRYLILCISVFLVAKLLGQNCGLESTVTLPPNSLDTVELEIFDLVNNDLADPGQGVCSVYLDFVHNSVGDFEIWLESPSGQQVQLVGPNASLPIQGVGFQFSVTFLAESLSTLPANGQWDNDRPNPTDVPQPFTGTFFPYSGRLDDFDTGPANGTWLLILQTHFTTLPINGLLRDVQVTFCDPTGENCCFAEAGALAVDSSLSVCAGDTLLQRPPSVAFGGDAPDSTQYAYTYLLSRDSTVIGYDAEANWSGLPPGNYQVFGLSYALADSLLLPTPDGTTRVDTLRSQLGRPLPPFCGSITPNAWMISVLAASDTTRLSPTICQGDTFRLADTLLTSAGTYTRRLRNAAGCDSVVEVALSVLPEVRTELDTVICQGDGIVVGTNIYTVPGTYKDTLTSQAGCDSIVSLRLDIVEPTRDTLRQVVCSGQRITVGGQSFDSTGVFSVVLPGSTGCDSIIVLDLTVLAPEAVVNSGPRTLTCDRPQILLDGSASSFTGMARYRWERQREGELAVDVVGNDPQLLVDQPGRYFLQIDQQEGALICSNRTGPILIDADTLPPPVEAGPDQVLGCTVPAVVLGSALVMPGPDLNITWTANGAAFPGDPGQPRPVVTEGGQYFLTVTNTNNGCSGIDSVLVQDESQDLNIDVGPDQVITCDQDSIDMSARIVPSSPTHTVTWYRAGNANDTITQSVNWRTAEAGLFVATVFNPVTGCQDSDTVQIALDTLAPVARINGSNTLTCTMSEIELEGTGSMITPETNVEWLALNGGVFLAQNGLRATANTAGTYRLILVEPRNGCRDSAEIQLADARANTQAVIETPLQIDCGRPIVRLDARNSQPTNHLRFEWSTPDGAFAGPPDEPVARVQEGGTYRLIVTDTLNECTDEAVVVVAADTAAPVLELVADGVLHCGNESVDLSTTAASSQGIMFGYQWSGPCVVGAADAESVSATCTGTYRLTITNLLTACIQTDSIVVTEDLTTPVSEATQDTFFLDCSTGTTILDATPSGNGNPVWWRGNTPVGSGPTLTVGDTGRYQLIVTNDTLSCADTTVVMVVADCRPQAVVGVPENLSCTRTQVTLDARGSENGTPLSYRWMAPNTACLSDSLGPQITVRCAGTYTLIVTHSVTGQSDTALVVVEQDASLPLADAGADQLITCTEPSVVLNGGNSEQGMAIAYVWLNEAGDTLSRDPVLTTNRPGTYLLEVQNTLTGCRAEDFAIVDQSAEVPDIRFGSRLFPCGQDRYVLTTAIVPPSSNYQFNWTGPGIVGSRQLDSVLLDQAGTYSLTVVDTMSGCQITESVTITTQECGPCLQDLTADTLTCLQPTVRLTAPLCAPCTSCTFLWTTTDGQIDSNPSQQELEVSVPGTYTLSVTDSLGITTQRSVIVVANQAAPTVDAGMDLVLDCDGEGVVLGNALPPPSRGQSYQWLDSMGMPLAMRNDREALVRRPGRYFLVMRNLQNGCANMDSLEVTRNTDQPVAEAGDDFPLDCENLVNRLDGGGSSEGPFYTYQWTAASGQIRGGENSLNPIVEGPGWYILEVTDSRNGCTAVDSVLLSAPVNFPELGDLPDPVIGCSQNSISIQAPIASAPELLYEWRSVADELLSDSRSVTINTPGTYQLTVTNANNGCRDGLSFSVSIDQDPPRINVPETVTLTCLDVATQIDTELPDDGTYRFTWTSANGLDYAGENGPVLRVTAQDSIFVEAENIASGCISRDTVVVTTFGDNPAIRAPQQQMLDCRVPAISLQASVGGDLADYAFNWTTENGQITGNPNVLGPEVSAPGTYTLVTTNVNTGCQSELTVVVIADRDQPQIVLDTTSGLRLTCATSLVTIDASRSITTSSQPPEYFWAVQSGTLPDGQQNQSALRVTDPVEVQLILTDPGNGCRDSLSVSVDEDLSKPPVPILAPAEPLTCERAFTELRVVNMPDQLAAVWILAGDTLASDQPQLRVDRPGRYQFVVSHPASACTETADIEVVAEQSRPDLFLTADGALGCQQSAVTLRIEQADLGLLTGIEWSGPEGTTAGSATGMSVTVDIPGTYTVSAALPNSGCRDTARLTLSPTATGPDSLAIDRQVVGCGADARGTIRVTQVFGGSGPYVYAFDDLGIFRNTPVRSNLPPGNYPVTVEDVNGCTLTQLVAIGTDGGLSLELGPDQEVISGDSLRLTPDVTGQPVRYIWRTENQVVGESNALWVQPERTQQYQLEVADEAGCRAIDRVTIFVRDDLPVYLPNAFAPDSPQEANRIFYIRAGAQVVEVERFEIFDRWGERIFLDTNFTPNDPSHGWSGDLGGVSLNAGVFVYQAIVRLRNGQRRVVAGDVSLLR